MKTKTPGSTQRVADHRARIAKEGGRQIAIMLTPEASQKLDQWTDAGISIKETVNRLLTKSKPPS